MKPNILIISEQFEAGDAVTGTNLFSKWDRAKLFCASRNKMKNTSIFASTYLIGEDEISNYLRFKKRQPQMRNNTQSIASKQKSRNSIKNIILELLWFFNIYNKSIKVQISDAFLSWIDNNQIHYIYSSVGSLTIAKLINQILDARPNLKIIYHGYDDWVHPNHYVINNNYYKESNIQLKRILKRAPIRWAMSAKMAKEYQHRYNLQFTVVPNPSPTPPCININKAIVNKHVNIVFIGKVGNHNWEKLCLLAKALSKIKYRNIRFDIYSKLKDTEKLWLNTIYANCKFHNWVEHTAIPQILSNSTILFLPISSNRSSIKYTKYSMSTKISEYLSSGTPIIYCGPPDIAMTDFFVENKCAFVETSNNIDRINTIINDIINLGQLSTEKINNAKTIFSSQFELSVVVDRIYTQIIKDFGSPDL